MVASRFKTITLAWVAISACAFAVSCGGKKPARRPTAPAQQAAATPAPTPAPSSELDRDSSQGAQTTIQSTPTPTPRPGAAWEDDADKLARDKKVKVVVYDSNGLSADDQARAQGQAISESDFHFSGAAADNVVALLKDRLDNVTDAAQKQRNQEFANDIGYVAAEFNFTSRTFRLTALMTEGNGSQHLDFTGSLDKDLKGKFGQDTDFPIVGELACLDLNGGCRNVRVRFLRQRADGNAEAYVVVRKAPAWMYVKSKAPDSTENAEFQKFASILFRTIKHSGAINTVHTLNLATSETVNGTSTFEVTMIMRVDDKTYRDGADHVLKWTGPLIRGKPNQALDVHVSPGYSNTRAGGNTIPMNDIFVSDWISRTRLTNNNGKGKIQLAITVRSTRPNVPEETLLLTIGAIREPVRYSDL